MFDIILVVVALAIVVGVLELKQRYTNKAVEQPKEGPVEQAVETLNKRELNEDFIERVLFLVGHALDGAEVYQEGGSVIAKYADGQGYKVSMFSASKLRQPKRRYAREVVKTRHAAPKIVPEPDYLQEPEGFWH